MQPRKQEEKKPGPLNIFAGLIATVTILIGGFFGLSIALAKAMQFQKFRDRAKQFNKKTLNPATLTIAGKSSRVYALLEHVGRKSGCTYQTPVVARPFSDGFVIPLPYGSNVDWCRNVLAAGTCKLTWDEQEYKLDHPELVPLKQALPAYPWAQRIIFSSGGIKECLQLHEQKIVKIHTPLEQAKVGV